MTRRIAVLLAAALLSVACYRDNASPHAQGAHNKPSDVTSGKTSTPGGTSTAPNTGTANTDTSGTYGRSGGQAGGVQAPDTQ